MGAWFMGCGVALFGRNRLCDTLKGYAVTRPLRAYLPSLSRSPEGHLQMPYAFIG